MEQKLDWRKGANGRYEAITPYTAKGANIVVHKDNGGDDRFKRSWTLVIVKRHADGKIYLRHRTEGIASLAQAKGLAPAILAALQGA